MQASRLAALIFCSLFGAAALASGADRMGGTNARIADFLPGALQAGRDLARAGEQLNGNGEEAAGAAARAIRTNPFDGTAAALLGGAYLRTGKAAQAQDALRVAALAGWREPMTQAYWYEMAMVSGDYTAASRRADALLRATPRAVSMGRLLAPIERDKSGRAALVLRLLEHPPWRSAYLAMDDVQARDAALQRAQTLYALSAAGGPVGCAGISPAVRMLLAFGLPQDARQSWATHCDASVAGGVADTGWSALGRALAAGDAASPFGWRRHPSADIAMSVEEGNGARLLRLTSTSTVNEPVLSQHVLLVPGRYIVRVTADAAGEAAHGRLSLSLSCGTQPQRPVHPAGDIAGSGQVVEAPACASQLLSLWLSPGPAAVMLGPLQIAKHP